MAAFPKLPNRDFHSIRNDLEETVMRLRNNLHPKLRIKLLRELRLLIQEADSLLESEE